jgi:hypothetical protein
MKLNVLTDLQGNIVGTARVGSFQLEDGTEIEAGFIPQAGQMLHEVEIAEDFFMEQMQGVGAYQKLDELIRPRLLGMPQLRKAK